MAKYKLSEARAQLSEIVERLYLQQEEPAIITKHGEPKAVILNYAEFEALVETLEVMADSEARSALQRDKKKKTTYKDYMKERERIGL